MAERTPHITVQNLTMAYGDFVLMRDLSYTVYRGDIFIIMGGSGCGKSTMMSVLIGLKKPAAGQVFYGDVDFWGSASAERDRIIRRAGVMYQGGALWSSMTLAENVALPLETYTNLTADEIKEVVALKLALVGLAGLKTITHRKSVAACRSGPGSRAPLPWILKFSSSTSLPPGWIQSAPAGWTT